ncbi:dTDP-4-dehydrorhamnose reductase [Teichococcus oryzae]|uniref:dTDP-4-dehydrorhamnose reductase n=1 Tax=Teichococcus oryzae TaxID=1608942 RepID=A0A5B2THL2_9PROT|nr:dTDP-4-dehydrorhamnose reductase [Pseudoroseomonas oryzae]KAA2213971.1 dTDP-4-dehydrorhamnose reductase [Pseudoroseomonas oryzae]
MRILIAGRSGQLARELADRLPRDGHEVTALGQPELDLAAPDTVRRAVEQVAPEAIVNAAAYTAVDRAEDERDAAFAVNAAGAGALAAEAARLGIPLVHVSTDYVFDGNKDAPYTEEDATGPTGVYGASKLAGEEAVLRAHPRSVVLRTAWVCGVHGNNFLKTMLRLGAERPKLSVVADQHGAPTFTADIAEAIARMLPALAAAPAGDPRFGLFHLSGAPYTTWHGFAAEIFRQAENRGHKVPELAAIGTADYPTKARRPANSRLDCHKIQQVHGIRPADWRQSLSNSLDTLTGPPR